MQETNILVSESSGLPTRVSSQGPACLCISPGQEFRQEMLLLGSRASSELAGKIHPCLFFRVVDGATSFLGDDGQGGHIWCS